MTIKSADDLIIATEAEKLGKPIPPAKSQPEATQIETKDDQKQPETGQEAQALETETQTQPPETAEAKETSESTDTEKSSSEDSIDEYGNKRSAKEKLYTQEEVNQLMRLRANRGRNPEQPFTQPQAQPPQANDSGVDSQDGEETWQQQLDKHIDTRITQRVQSEQQQAWEAAQHKEQQVYEEKFTSGARKYADFEGTVGGKPITASMMVATKAMEDPAAFIYAACKNHPKELERIASLTDPTMQIVEVARLEERMRKPKAVTNAPVPIKKVQGDTTDAMPKQSIDSLIAKHAKDKIMNNRNWK